MCKVNMCKNTCSLYLYWGWSIFPGDWACFLRRWYWKQPSPVPWHFFSSVAYLSLIFPPFNLYTLHQYTIDTHWGIRMVLGPPTEHFPAVVRLFTQKYRLFTMVKPWRFCSFSSHCMKELMCTLSLMHGHCPCCVKLWTIAGDRNTDNGRLGIDFYSNRCLWKDGRI